MNETIVNMDETIVKYVDKDLFKYIKDKVSLSRNSNINCKKSATNSLSLLCHLPYEKSRLYLDLFYMRFGAIIIKNKLNPEEPKNYNSKDIAFITIMILDILCFWDILRDINSIYRILYISKDKNCTRERSLRFDSIGELVYDEERIHKRIPLNIPRSNFTFVFYDNENDRLVFDTVSLPLLYAKELDNFTNLSSSMKDTIDKESDYLYKMNNDDLNYDLNRQFSVRANVNNFITDHLDRFGIFIKNTRYLALEKAFYNAIYNTCQTRDDRRILFSSVYVFTLDKYIKLYIDRKYIDLDEIKLNAPVECILSRKNIEISIEKCNDNDKYFDYIRVTLYIVTGDGFDAQSKYIQANKDILAKFVLNKVKESKKFQKLNVPITILELSDVRFTRQFLLIYTFGIKKELLALQEEKAEG